MRGGFGVLDDGNGGLLWRSLLWQRAHDAPRMRRINFASVNKGLAAAIVSPPSWSWMAYSGAIEYLELLFDQVDWEKDEIRSRWSHGAGKTWSYSRDYSTCPLELTVAAREFDWQAARTLDGAGIKLDDPDRREELASALQCVVLGKLKIQTQELGAARTHYVLLVTPRTSPESDGGASHIYERVGVGCLPGALINFGMQVKVGRLQ